MHKAYGGRRAEDAAPDHEVFVGAEEPVDLPIQQSASAIGVDHQRTAEADHLDTVARDRRR